MDTKKGTNRRRDGLNITEMAREAGVSRQAIYRQLESGVIPFPTVRESLNLLATRKAKAEAKRIAKAEAKRTADTKRTAIANIGQWKRTPDTTAASPTPGSGTADTGHIARTPDTAEKHRTPDTQTSRTVEADTGHWTELWRTLKRWLPRRRPRPISDDLPSKAHIAIHVFSTILVTSIIASQNVWPNIKMLLEPDADSSGWGNVFGQIAIIFMLGLVLLFLKYQKRQGMRNMTYFIAAFLSLVTFTYTLKSVGHVHELEIGKNITKSQQIDTTTAQRDRDQHTLDSLSTVSQAEIDRITKERDKAREERDHLPNFTPTNDGAINSTQKSVDELQALTDKECGILFGSNCRKLQNKLADKLKDLATLQANKALQDRVDGYNAKIERMNNAIEGNSAATKARANELTAAIKEANKTLDELGPKPTDIDPTAAYVSLLTFHILTPEVISPWIPTLQSAGADILAVWGPEVVTVIIAALLL
jgi:predicted DNA-binding protein YlxM (UPF0122 family)